MAIGKAIRPEVIVAGTVQDIAPRKRRDSTEVYRYDVTLRGENGGQVGVEYWVRDGQTPPLPDVLEFVAVIAEASDSQQYGSSLSYARDLTENDLDKLHSSLVGSGSLAKV